MSVTVLTYPSDFKPDMMIEGIQQHFESHGFDSARTITGSKSVYRNSKPKDLIIFNANVFMKDMGKVWYGDLNLTEEYMELKSIADSLDTTLYVLWEMEGRFGKEKRPIDELIKKSVWNTDEVKPTKDWYLSVRMKEKR